MNHIVAWMMRCGSLAMTVAAIETVAKAAVDHTEAAPVRMVLLLFIAGGMWQGANWAERD